MPQSGWMSSWKEWRSRSGGSIPSTPSRSSGSPWRKWGQDMYTGELAYTQHENKMGKGFTVHRVVYTVCVKSPGRCNCYNCIVPMSPAPCSFFPVSGCILGCCGIRQNVFVWERKKTGPNHREKATLWPGRCKCFNCNIPAGRRCRGTPPSEMSVPLAVHPGFTTT